MRAAACMHVSKVSALPMPLNPLLGDILTPTRESGKDSETASSTSARKVKRASALPP